MRAHLRTSNRIKNSYVCPSLLVTINSTDLSRINNMSNSRERMSEEQKVATELFCDPAFHVKVEQQIKFEISKLIGQSNPLPERHDREEITLKDKFPARLRKKETKRLIWSSEINVDIGLEKLTNKRDSKFLPQLDRILLTVGTSVCEVIWSVSIDKEVFSSPHVESLICGTIKWHHRKTEVH